MVCPTNNYTILTDRTTTDTATPVNVYVNMKGLWPNDGAGKEYRILALGGNPLGLGIARLSTGTLKLDSNGCGAVAIKFRAAGTYTIYAVWCDVWGPSGVHCMVSDAYTYNSVIITVTKAIVTTCSEEADCDIESHCLMGYCIPDPCIIARPILGGCLVDLWTLIIAVIILIIVLKIVL